MRPRVFRLLSNRRFQGTITFILHYPDLGTTARKIGTAKSANSAKRSRRRLAINRKVALPTTTDEMVRKEWARGQDWPRPELLVK